MLAKVFSLDGKVKGEIEVKNLFSEKEVREDLIKKVVIAMQSNRRKKYGRDPLAGKRTSAHYHGSRNLPPDQRMMNRELARMKRIHGDCPPHLFLTARFVPQAVKGRVAHPPKAERDWSKKVNKKEKLKAFLSALLATIKLDWVRKRGHLYDGELPLIVEERIEELKKTKEVFDVLKKLNLDKDIERAKKKKIRAGKGKRRGRKYRKKKSVLIVVSKKCNLQKAARNLPGVEVVLYDQLNVEYLAPGTHAGRLVVWSKEAILELDRKLEEQFNKLSS